MRLRIKVKPKRKRLGLKDAGPFDNVDFVVSLTQPAEGNKANRQLVEFLEKATGKNVSIVAGATAKLKLVEIDGEGKEIREKLERMAGKGT